LRGLSRIPTNQRYIHGKREEISARARQYDCGAHAGWSAISLGSQGPGIWMGCECVHRPSQAAVCDQVLAEQNAAELREKYDFDE
jgi:hypothetical protein